MSKKAFILLCLILTPLLISAEESATAPVEDAGGETAAGLRAAFTSYLTAFEAKDIDGVMSAFADAPNTVLMGTGPDEIWVGTEAIRMAHIAFMESAKEENSKERTLVSLGANGDVAWVSGFIVITQELEEGQNVVQINLSIVFEKLEEKWHITAMHFSNLSEK